MSTPEKESKPHTSPYAERFGLDPVIHEPARLIILVILNTIGEGDFQFLESATQLRPGNLSAQAAKLEEAGYISVEKFFKKKYPATKFKITPAGKAALEAYWQLMNVIQQGAEDIQQIKRQGDEPPQSGRPAPSGLLPSVP